jgi:hypothetical protein
MPALETAAFIGGGLDLLKQKKLQKAASGSKSFSMPKTAVGKLIGGLSGRTEAAQITTQMKESVLSPKAEANLMQQGAQRTPVTGGFSFGGEAAKKTYLPFAIVAAVVAIFYAMRRRKGGRRRY